MSLNQYIIYATVLLTVRIDENLRPLNNNIYIIPIVVLLNARVLVIICKIRRTLYFIETIKRAFKILNEHSK